MKYRVEMLERWTRTVEVEADSEEAAMDLAQAAAESGEGKEDFHSDLPRDTWTVEPI